MLSDPHIPSSIDLNNKGNSSESFVPRLQQLLNELPVVMGEDTIKIGNGLTVTTSLQYLILSPNNQPTYSFSIKDGYQRVVIIDFTPNTTSSERVNVQVEYQDRSKIMFDFLLSLFKLMEILDTQELCDVAFIMGTTEDEMLTFVKKLGAESIHNFDSRVVIPKKKIRHIFT